MSNSGARISSKGKHGRRDLVLLGSGFAALCGIITMWPNGIMGFMQGIAEARDAFSIMILVSLIGILFVLLYKIGISMGYVEEVDAVKV